MEWNPDVLPYVATISQTNCQPYAFIAQWIEQQFPKLQVVGSTPTESTMIIFIDDFKRPEWYGLTPGEFFQFTEGDRALAFCKEAIIDVLYLDHDLGETMSGYWVLAHLVEEFKNVPKSVVCISLNPAGTKRIAALCEKHGIPFEYRLPPADIFMDTEHYG